MTLRDSREMNYDSKLQTWAGSATLMWTRCPRQTWSHGSLAIKHYRVLVGNHHWGYRNLVHELVFAQQLLFLEQFNQWLGVLGNTYGVEVINLPNHRIHLHMHSWLGMVPEETKTTFLELTVATYIKCTWIRGSIFFHPNIYLMNGTRGQRLQSFQH